MSRSKMPLWLTITVSGALMAMASTASALPYSIILESDDDRASGSEVFLVNYADIDDVVAHGSPDLGFSQLDIGANFSIGGVAYDGDAYRVLLESDDDRTGGSEVFLASFDDLADLYAGDLSGGAFSSLNLGGNFGVGGFAFDGSDYQLLLESNDDRAGGSEVFLGSFTSIDELLAGTLDSGAFSGLNIGANFSVGGMTFDGSAYQLLLESDDDRDAGSEVFLAGFNTIADLIDGGLSTGSFTNLNIGPNFSIGGFAYQFADVVDDIVEVPAPTAFALLALGLAGLGAGRQRRGA